MKLIYNIDSFKVVQIEFLHKIPQILSLLQLDFIMMFDDIWKKAFK